MDILRRIIFDKRIEIEERKRACSIDCLAERIGAVAPCPDFIRSLRSVPMGIIAEVKRKSPSAGMIREPFDPVAIAQAYQDHGANAVSCLMDHKYFGGGEGDFSAVRNAIQLPMLYKEFVVDPWQILHAKTQGASAVLLIAGALTDREIGVFMEEIRRVGLQPLVEVHDREEMLRAINAGADCIGINNRNLRSFETTLETTLELATLAPTGCTLVSESGIKSPEDVVLLRASGAHAVLVGETLLRTSDPGLAVSTLMAGVWS